MGQKNLDIEKPKGESPLEETSLIDYNLSLTPEERVINHQRALDTINELKKAGRSLYGEHHPSSKDTPRE